MYTWLLISIAVFILLMAGTGIYVLYVHNWLTQLATRYRNRFDRIEIHLSRRHDLLNTLLGATEDQIDLDEDRLPGSITSKNRTPPEIEKASDRPGDPDPMNALEELENQLTGVLEHLKNEVNHHPDLKEDDRFTQLFDVVRETEEKISFACEAYNEDVEAYNNVRSSFPVNLFAFPLGHSRDAVKLEFDGLEFTDEKNDLYF